MEIRDFLNQYISAQNTVEALYAERERVFELAASATAAERKSSDPVGRNVPKLKEIDCKISETIAELSERRDLVENAINSINDTRIRDVLRYRYLSGMNYKKIATKMYYSERWVIKLHGMGLSMLRRENKNCSL